MGSRFQRRPVWPEILNNHPLFARGSPSDGVGLGKVEAGPIHIGVVLREFSKEVLTDISKVERGVRGQSYAYSVSLELLELDRVDSGIRFEEMHHEDAAETEGSAAGRSDQQYIA